MMMAMESLACCAPLSSGPLSPQQAQDLAVAFRALSDPVRVQVLNRVVTADGGEICACDLVVPVGRSQPTVSHHLKVLRQAGLVHANKRQTNVWYSADHDRLGALRDALAPMAAPAD
jgi:ArsR family transcriptional regulator